MKLSKSQKMLLFHSGKYPSMESCPNFVVTILFLNQILCCHHSLESSHRDDSNKWLQYRILLRLMKILFVTDPEFAAKPQLRLSKWQKMLLFHSGKYSFMETCPNFVVDYLISQPNPMLSPFVGIVSLRRFQQMVTI